MVPSNSSVRMVLPCIESASLVRNFYLSLPTVYERGNQIINSARVSSSANAVSFLNNPRSMEHPDNLARTHSQELSSTFQGAMGHISRYSLKEPWASAFLVTSASRASLVSGLPTPLARLYV